METAPARTSSVRVDWRRSTGDYVESHCGRWRITPIYGGCTRPERYELRLDDRVVGGGENQRECKEDADRWIRDRHEASPVATIARSTAERWARYGACRRCGVDPGRPCVATGDRYSLLWAPAIKRPHRGRVRRDTGEVARATPDRR
jgi:hypothetical protein